MTAILHTVAPQEIFYLFDNDILLSSYMDILHIYISSVPSFVLGTAIVFHIGIDVTCCPRPNLPFRCPISKFLMNIYLYHLYNSTLTNYMQIS